MTLVPLVTPAVGVKVAVQWMLSLVVRLLRVPLEAVMSARLNPVTASLKVMFTTEEPPRFSPGLATATVAVGRTVSTA